MIDNAAQYRIVGTDIPIGTDVEIEATDEGESFLLIPSDKRDKCTLIAWKIKATAGGGVVLPDGSIYIIPYREGTVRFINAGQSTIALWHGRDKAC